MLIRFHVYMQLECSESAAQQELKCSLSRVSLGQTSSREFADQRRCVSPPLDGRALAVSRELNVLSLQKRYISTFL